MAPTSRRLKPAKRETGEPSKLGTTTPAYHVRPRETGERMATEPATMDDHQADDDDRRRPRRRPGDRQGATLASDRAGNAPT